jgi:hypothetical protein
MGHALGVESHRFFSARVKGAPVFPALTIGDSSTA